MKKNSKIIEELESELEEMQNEHMEASKIYGSELCAGDMINKENNLKEKIKKLKDEMES